MQAPEFSVDLYREITEFAHGTPSWLHTVAEIGTDAGLLLFAALFVAGWWRARDADARAMGLALAAPFAVVAAYLVSEVSKTFVEEERPCRAVAGVVSIAECPVSGDWSFPSNHATIAAASAAAIVVAWRAMAPVVLPLALLMAFSRVFVGVHYPHDVAAGVVLGCVVAPVVAVLLMRAVAPLVVALRRVPVGVVLLGSAGPAAGAVGDGAGGGVPVGAPPGAPGGASGGAPAGMPGGAVPRPGDAGVTMPDVMGGVVPRREPPRG